MNNKVAIIGSGIAGIATSIRLKAKGFDVTVYEKNSFPGGKLSSFKLGEFRFDAGPSLFTMPQYVDELFEISGENPKNILNTKRKLHVNIFGKMNQSLTLIQIKKNFMMNVKTSLMLKKTNKKIS